ncbi:MAG: four helix bundle protein [Phycisphaerales bacterium]
MQNFRDLKAWQKAHQLTLDVYRATKAFPSDERFGLTSQIRRATSSIPLNLAESCGYATDKSRAHATQIAVASSCEVEYALLLSHDLGYIDQPTYEDFQGRVSEVRRMMLGLLSHLRKATD